MVEHLYAYNRELNDLIEEEAEKHKIREIQKMIKRIGKNYEVKIKESIQYCNCHPDSTFLNKVEFKMKLKFESIAKELILTLEKI